MSGGGTGPAISTASTGITAEGLDRRRRAFLLAAVGLAGSAWIYLALGARGSGVGVLLSALDPLPSQVRTFAISFIMWAAMVVAMMVPPLIPWVLFFGAARDSASKAPARLFSFVGGYGLIWAGYCAAAALVQVRLSRLGMLIAPDLKVVQATGALILLGAGLFQLSPIKDACLRHCRSPLGFFLRRWRDGPTGAFAMGAQHGLYCLGCCWAIMGVAFALGVMNLGWMAAATLIVCLEQLLPRGRVLGRGVGVALIIWGLAGLRWSVT